MNKLAELMIGFVELLEAEGRLLQSKVLKLLVCGLLAVCTLCITLAALFFLGRGLFIYFVSLWGELYASLALGGVLFIISGILVWQAKRTLN